MGFRRVQETKKFIVTQRVRLGQHISYRLIWTYEVSQRLNLAPTNSLHKSPKRLSLSTAKLQLKDIFLGTFLVAAILSGSQSIHSKTQLHKQIIFLKAQCKLN